MLRPFAGTFDPRTAEPLDVSTGKDREGVVCLVDGWIEGLPDEAPESALVEEWRRWGSELPGRLRGDFALLLWDQQSRRGLLARDRLGSRALYLHESGGRLTFAGELRGLLSRLGRTPEPDPVALALWIGFADLRGDRTLFSGVRRLPPGGFLELDDAGWRERRSWTPTFERTLRVDRREAAGLVRSGMERAVARCLPERAPAAIQLSGGLDSSAVASVAMRTRTAPPPVAAYSATFPAHPVMDESRLIDELGERLGIASVQLQVTGGSVLAGGLAYARDWLQPLHSPNLHYQQPLFARMAADGVAVVLDGEGGDELFGAVRHLMADRMRAGRVVGAIRLARCYPGAGDEPPWPIVLRFVRDAGLKTALPHGLHGRLRRLGDQSRHASPLLLPAAAQRLVAAEDPWAWERLPGPRWWAYLTDLMTGAMDAAGSFAHLNRRAAGAGLECRHPMRDPELVELMLRLPPELSFDPHFSRPLLREAMAGLVPDSVRLRPGKGVFEPLFHAGLISDLPVLEALLGPGAEVGAHVDLGRVRRELLPGPHACPRGRFMWAEELWRVAAAECWLRELADPGFAGRILESRSLAPLRAVLVERPAARIAA